MEEIFQERAEEAQRERTEEVSQETTFEVEPQEIEVVVEEGEAKAFYSNKGAEAFQKHLAKKGFVEERGFKKLVSPFKE